jgi:hypothetical protein
MSYRIDMLHLSHTNPRHRITQVPPILSRTTASDTHYYSLRLPPIDPTNPGGSKWERNVPPPKLVCIAVLLDGCQFPCSCCWCISGYVVDGCACVDHKGICIRRVEVGGSGNRSEWQPRWLVVMPDCTAPLAIHTYKQTNNHTRTRAIQTTMYTDYLNTAAGR